MSVKTITASAAGMLLALGLYTLSATAYRDHQNLQSVIQFILAVQNQHAVQPPAADQPTTSTTLPKK
jgi:hypothetical protein